MRKLTIARGVLVCAAAAFLASGSAEAQETDAAATGGEVTTSTEGAPAADSTTESGAESVPTGKIAAEFQDFLGPDAESVVRGLRDGESFTLTEATPAETPPGETPPGETPGQPGTTTEVTIEPATGKMGYGNVRTALQLSQFQLQQAGIEQPTASQLDAALNGGSVTNSEGTTTELQGALALRSEGMGWGRIAQEYGTKVGWVKNGRANMSEPSSGGTDGEAGDSGGDALATSGDAASGDDVAVEVVGGSSEAGDGIVDAAGNGALNRASGSGHGALKKSGAGAVITGTGAPSGRGRGHGVVTGLGASSQGHGRGRGIVNALGGSSQNRGGSHVTTGLGSSSGSNGHGRGHGIVTGMGGSSHGHGNSHVTTGLGESSGSHGRGGSHGNAGGNGKGHGRGK